MIEGIVQDLTPWGADAREEPRLHADRDRVDRDWSRRQCGHVQPGRRPRPAAAPCTPCRPGRQRERDSAAGERNVLPDQQPALASRLRRSARPRAKLRRSGGVQRHVRELRDGARPSRAEQARARRQRQFLRRARTPACTRSRYPSRRGPSCPEETPSSCSPTIRGPSSSDPIRASSGGRSDSVVSTSPSSASRRQSFTGMHLVLPPAFIIPIAMSVEARRRCRLRRCSNSATSAISRFGGGIKSGRVARAGAAGGRVRSRAAWSRPIRTRTGTSECW